MHEADSFDEDDDFGDVDEHSTGGGYGAATQITNHAQYEYMQHQNSQAVF